MKKLIVFFALFCVFVFNAMAAIAEEVIVKVPTLKEYLLGGLEVNLFIACLLFAGLGILLALTLQALFRNKYSETTPTVWSWKFWFLDNWRKALITIILVYISIVFSYQVFQVEISTWFAFLIGLGFDNILKLVKNKKQELFTPKRQELTDKIENNG